MAKKTDGWYRLDNAAKIYPVSARRNWQAIYRLSCDLRDPIDPAVLERALARVMARFPFFSVRLRRGAFWYYFEHIDGIPPVLPDTADPCIPIVARDNNHFCLKVRYYENRIAVEFFHVLTDGTGGITFLKTLAAEYIRQFYGVEIPAEKGVCDCGDEPRDREREDSFLIYAKDEVTMSRQESNAWQLTGTPETDGRVNVTTGIMPSERLRELARASGVTITEYLTATIIESLARLHASADNRKGDIKVSVPVSLRRFYGSETLRNFSSYINVGIDPRMGEFSFDEILHTIRHQLELELTSKRLCARFSTNVRDERNMALRIAPLFLKYVVMKLVFLCVSERKISTTMSNLGVVELPDAMKPYVTRFDFILGLPAANAANCTVLSYDGKLFFNVTRRIKEPFFERALFGNFVEKGVNVTIESNRGWE